MLDYRKAQFLNSAAELTQLPVDQGAEVAFIGRSNAGKSSALNCLVEQKQLARVSKTPGRTQLINLFSVTDECRLVDLPGYGFAKVPQKIKARWAKTVNDYLQTRECLQGLIVIMDVRHPMTDLDSSLVRWASMCQLPIHVLLTKSDKLKRGPATASLHKVEKQLAEINQSITVQLFSSLKKTGVDHLRKKINLWMSP